MESEHQQAKVQAQQVTLRYPIKVEGTVFPAGTVVRKATLEEMRKVWRGIQAKEGSQQVGIWLPGRECPMVVHTNQLKNCC
jgi:hypothetical protein